MATETFSDFNVVQATQFLQIREILPWQLTWRPVEPTSFLAVGLQGVRRQIGPGSNEWEQRLYMELVFVEALQTHYGLKMWQERQIDYGESPFRGKVDFAITPHQIAFTTPFLVLIEAKKENFDLGWGQCLIAMKTCQLLNQRDGVAIDIFGIVSTGMVWEFGKYTVDNQFYKSDSYALTQPDSILGLLDAVLTECEQSIIPV